MDRLVAVVDDIGCNLVVVQMDWQMDYNQAVVPLVLVLDKVDIVHVVVLDSMLMVDPGLVGAGDAVPVSVLHQMVLVLGQAVRVVQQCMVLTLVVGDKRVVEVGELCKVPVSTLVAVVVEGVEEVDLLVVVLVDGKQAD